MYVLPQEIEVWYVIPAIRKELARVFIKKYHMKYENIANILGISKAAVSQYINEKRATSVRFPKEIKKEIEKSAKIILKNNKKVMEEIMRLIKKIKKKGCLCKICKKYNKGIIKICNMKPVEGE
jgi:predicted transcriptional regulator